MHQFYSLYLILPIIYIPLITTSSIFDIPGLNFASVNLGLYHVLSFINMIDVHHYSKSMTLSPKYILINFMYLYSDVIMFFIHNISFLALSITYQELIFKKLICSSNDCTTIDHIYESGIVIHGITCSLILSILVFYIYTFISKRIKTWSKIVNFSDLTSFNAQFSEECSCMVGIDNYINEFIEKWINKDTSYMISECEESASRIFNMLLLNKENLDEIISINKVNFDLACHNLGCSRDDNKERLWNVFQSDGMITKHSIYLHLWDMYCEKRMFASAVYTDKKVVVWIVLFFSLFLYGLGVVFVIDIFNYEEAFGNGVDVFKIYLLIATYFIGILKDRLQFIFVMIRTRPYNVNDIIRIGSDLWHVKDITSRNLILQGNSYYVIPNTNVYANGVVNYSRGFVRDSVLLRVPISYYGARERVYKLLSEYMEMYPDQIKDIAVVYDGMSDMNSTLRIIWTFTHNVYAISRYNSICGSLSKYIYENVQKDVEKNSIEFLSVNGGAYNDVVNKFKFD